MANNRRLWKFSRAKCLFKFLEYKKYNSVADIGSGDRTFTKKLPYITLGNIYAVDIGYPEKQHNDNNIICLNDISKLPVNEVDCLVLMDVLEHIENDYEFLKDSLSKLIDHGTILITVPAIQRVFSSHDLVVGHYRRYNRKRLLSLLESNSLRVIKCHYFYTSLLVVKYLFLMKNNMQQSKGVNNECTDISSLVGNKDANDKGIKARIISALLNFDFWFHSILDKLHIHVPGLSLVAFCEKSDN